MATVTIQQALDLAIQHINAGRMAEAGDVCQQILASFPQHWPAMHLLAIAKYRTGDAPGGIELLRRAVTIEPNAADCYNNLGEMLRSLGRLDEAEQCYTRCIQLNPQSSATYSNLGELHRQQGKLDQAIACQQRAIQLSPNDATPHMNLGVALHDSRRLDEAIASYRQALALAPNHVDAHGNLGAALMDASRVEEAMAEFSVAHQLAPSHHLASLNLGTALTYLHRIDEAIPVLERAISLNPQWGDSHVNLAYALLLSGQWKRGFEEYEWRFRSPKWPAPRVMTVPQWDGSDISGKRIFVHPEQGLGDAIQFARYITMLADRGATVILESYDTLRSLFGSLRGVSGLISKEQSSGRTDFDFHIPMLSLPRAFGTTVETIPTPDGPYLKADDALRAGWRERLSDAGQSLKIGLVWAGRTTYIKDIVRSMSLSLFAPLGQVDGARFYSLQYGPAGQQEAPDGLDLIRLDSQLRDFSDTAALVSELDLLITVDTAPAHLAGALGKPVWTLLPFNGDWRWGMTGDATPWYPTMRLFRQPKIGDWGSVVQRVTEELGTLAGSSNRRS